MIIAIIAFILLVGATIFLHQLVEVFEDPFSFKLLIGGFFVVYLIVALCFKAVLPPVSETPPQVSGLFGGVSEQISAISLPNLPELVVNLFKGSQN